jgi:uncharacterized metal-binding protein YceD (DUF177 family)
MDAPAPEFSRILSVTRISSKGVEERLEAKPAERTALAKRFDLVDLPALKAYLTLIPGPQQTIGVTGAIVAEVVQRCVVTLEPVASRLEIDVKIVFIPSKSDRDKMPLSDELDDEFEFFSGGKIDIGEIVSQQLGVALNPYPRKADAALTVTEFGKNIEKQRPFAKLATAVKSKKNKDKR